MDTLVISVEKKADLTLLKNLVKKMGMSAMTLTPLELEDWKFAQKIEKGMKSGKVSKSEVLQVLKK